MRQNRSCSSTDMSVVVLNPMGHTVTSPLRIAASELNARAARLRNGYSVTAATSTRMVVLTQRNTV